MCRVGVSGGGWEGSHPGGCDCPWQSRAQRLGEVLLVSCGLWCGPRAGSGLGAAAEMTRPVGALLAFLCSHLAT